MSSAPLSKKPALTRDSVADPGSPHREFFADDLVMAAIVDEMFARLELEKTEELVSTLLGAMSSAAVRTVEKHGNKPYNPENPIDVRGLTRALRELGKYQRQGDPDLDEARQLAAIAVNQFAKVMGRSVGDLRHLLLHFQPPPEATEPNVDGPFLAIVDSVWDLPDPQDEVSIWDEAETPADPQDPLQQLLNAHGVQTHLDRPGPTVLPSRDAVKKLLSLLNISRLRKLLSIAVSRDVRRKAREYAQKHAQDPRYSQADGYAAENVIRLAYLSERASAEILTGTVIARLAGTSTATTTPLSATVSQAPLWDLIRTGLLSYFTGAVGQPDILDPYVAGTVGHVYEIKPARSAVEGTRKLYGRYLFWLNLYEVISANASTAGLWAAAYAASIARGGAPPRPPKGHLQPPARTWLPGDWTPQAPLKMPDLRPLLVEAPVPGVLCYTLGPKPDEKNPVPVPVSVEEQQKDTISRLGVVLIAAAAAGDLAEPAGVLSLAAAYPAAARAAGSMSDEGAALESTVKLGAIVILVGLAIFSLPELAPSAVLQESQMLAQEGAAGLALLMGGPELAN